MSTPRLSIPWAKAIVATTARNSRIEKDEEEELDLDFPKWKFVHELYSVREARAH
jgi:hypothetical protein